MKEKRLAKLFKSFLLAFFLFPAFQAFAQNKFYGRVVEAKSKTPVPYATIYLNNTTFGAIANPEGEFEMDLPDGNYEIIVRLLGYETLTFFINTAQLAQQGYRVEILESEQELDEIKVEEKRDPSWYRNLKTFKKNFLGYSINAQKTEILNEESLILDSESGSRELKVSSKEALQIKNENLGYQIDYILKQFSLSIKEGKVVYGGNALFKDDQDLKNRKLRRVIKNRDRAYYGSIQHLMQALHFGRAIEQGYIFQEIRRIPNPERPSQEVIDEAKKIYSESENQDVKDSLRINFLNKEKLPEFARQLIDAEINPESFICRTEDGRVFMEIKDLIQVSYLKENEEINYVGLANAKNVSFQKSIIDQLNPNFEIFPNGTYSDTFGLLFEGYMAWEKVGDLMPLDYLPVNIPWRGEY